MKVEYIDHMGSDLSVVNAARVSFDKASEWAYEVDGEDKVAFNKVLGNPDKKLISYLAKHGHWSPFAHTSISMRWKAPIFVARQLVKHQVGLTWNEVSRRYVKTEPELWWPEKWRKAAENVKQGSSEEEFPQTNMCLKFAIMGAKYQAQDYLDLVEQGLCPEQARMFLPQNTYTEWIWTGSLYAWVRVWKQRTYPTAQLETRELVKQIEPIMKQYFPVSWEALTKE
jgi:thymidylate synthase (FAD)